MDNCTKAVLTVIALCVLALPVKAEEKVYYCEMTGLAQTNVDGAETYKTQKFKMKVTSTEVVFGSGGYFDGSILRITNRPIPSFFDAQNEDGSAHISFDEGKFHFSIVTYDYVTAMSARCDDF